MNLTPEVLLSAARYTLQNPRAGARVILSLGLTTGQALLALVLIAVLSTLLTAAALLIVGRPSEAELQITFSNPFALAVMQTIVLTFGAGMVHLVGQKFGGRGSFSGALALIGWMEFILLLVQVAQLVAFLMLPVLVDALLMMGLVVSLWLLTHFIAELHGFDNVWAVFGGIVATFLLVAVAILLVSLFGTGV